jgi:hypothetical protein
MNAAIKMELWRKIFEELRKRPTINKFSYKKMSMQTEFLKCNQFYKNIKIYY